jgi:glycosyltransferase involved in cell wall biosynthesis
MTISVVIPCHNYGRFLVEAIASLDAQERPADEIVVCDDGSDDDSWSVIQQLQRGHPEMQLIRHERAKGAIATFNELVSRSTGDIVVIFSADDRLGPSFLRRMEEDLTAYEWDFGYSDFRAFGAEEFYFDAPLLDVDVLARSNFISGTSAFRRSLFDRVGGYRPAFEGLGFEDYDFWLSALENGASGGKVSGCYFEWRRHAGGSRNTAGLLKRIQLRWMLFRYHPRFFVHPRTIRVLTGRVHQPRGRPAPEVLR